MWKCYVSSLGSEIPSMYKSKRDGSGDNSEVQEQSYVEIKCNIQGDLVQCIYVNMRAGMLPK